MHLIPSFKIYLKQEYINETAFTYYFQKNLLKNEEGIYLMSIKNDDLCYFNIQW